MTESIADLVEPVEVALCRALAGSLLPDAEAIITLTNRVTGAVVSLQTRRIAPNPRKVDLGPLPPGEFRITITARAETMPLSDVVASPADLDQ